MTTLQFDKDLNDKGIPCEKEALKRIQLYLDIGAYRIEGYDKGKDIVAPNIDKKFEVKNCQDARICVPVEISCEGEDSGITTTKSDYWVFFCHDSYMVIETDILKDLIKNIEAKPYDLFGRKVIIKSLLIKNLFNNSKFIWVN